MGSLLVVEDKQGFPRWVAAPMASPNPGESIERPAHIDRFGRDEDGLGPPHYLPRSASSIVRSSISSPSTAPGPVIAIPPVGLRRSPVAVWSQIPLSSIPTPREPPRERGYFEQSLALRRALAEKEPGRADFQRGLAASF